MKERKWMKLNVRKRRVLRRFSEDEYKATIDDPVAFHKWILGIKWDPSEAQKAIMRAFAKYPETLVICGSKSGKSTLSAELTLWRIYKLLLLDDPCAKYNLNPGTNIYSMNIAPKEDIATGVVLNYITGFAENSWYMSDYIVTPRSNELEFTDHIIARAQGSSSRAGRGYAIYTLLFDEFCHFIDTKGNLSGTQCVNAFMPRLLPFGEDGRFIGISTPAGRSGAAFDMFSTGEWIAPYIIQKMQTQNTQKFRAVFQIPTWVMNPLFPYEHPFLKKELQRDPWFFKREYGSEFADVVTPFFDMRQVEKCLKAFYVPPEEKTNNYAITLDAGLKHDNFALAMGHLDKEGKVIIDLTEVWSPKYGEQINMVKIEDRVSSLCQSYKVVDILGDERLITPTIQRLQNIGLPARGYQFTTTSDMLLYENLIQLVNGQGIIIQESDMVKEEFRHLQRIVLADRFRVQAGPGSTDDLSDAIALLAYSLTVEMAGGGTLLFRRRR